MHEELERAFSLDGRIAVVTGAASGIGRQTAVTFAQAGADVVVADLAEDGLEGTAEQIRALGRTATVAPTDVSERAAVDALARAALDADGRIDVWANVAGVIRYGNVVDVPEEDLDLILSVNVKGVYWGCAAAARAMVERGTGSIVNVASGAIDVPAPSISGYALSKAAVAQLTRTLAGMTEVHWKNPDGTVDESRRDQVFAARSAQAPLGIVGDPADMAWAMLYLAADASRFVTGQILRPNGGVAMA